MVSGMKLENLALVPCENQLSKHTSESNTAGLDKEFFCPTLHPLTSCMGDYRHFGGDQTQKYVPCL